MALPPACKPKWDWDLAFALFCGGLNDEQIMAHPQFRGLPKSTLISARCRQDWTSRRAALARLPSSNAADNAAKALSERLREEGINHQQWLLTELERERNVFSRRARSADEQQERLQSLKLLDELARRTSRLDEQKESNPITQGFAVLVHLQQSNGQAMLQKTTPSAIMVLPDETKASEGILRSNNAHPEPAEDADFTDLPEGWASEEGPKPMPEPGSLFGATPIAPKV